MVSPYEFLANHKPQISFYENAVKWAKRVLLLSNLTRLVREYKAYEARRNAADKVDGEIPSLLNFIPSSHLAKI